MAQQRRDKNKDYEALQSPFMRIPQMKIDVARGLLNIGVTQIYHLEGRSPESLLAEMQKTKVELRDDVIAYLRMAVYYAENQPPEASKLYPTVWM